MLLTISGREKCVAHPGWTHTSVPNFCSPRPPCCGTWDSQNEVVSVHSESVHKLDKIKYKLLRVSPCTLPAAV